MRYLLAALALVLVSAGTQAQALVTANDRDTILEAAKEFGDARFESTDDGIVYITGRIEGLGYHIFFNDCGAEGSQCGAIGFRAGFPGDDVTLDMINDWNVHKLFGRAYLYRGSARVQMDVNLDHGVNRSNFDDTFAVWRAVMHAFAEHIGFQQ